MAHPTITMRDIAEALGVSVATVSRALKDSPRISAEQRDRIKYQSAIIHKATIAEDREKLWDNKKVWQALESKGFQIMSGLDVIEYTLKAGEKDRIIDAIDTLSGYESNIEEVAKN